MLIKLGFIVLFMKITAAEFLDSPRKSVTLMGMSGCGKTHFSKKLAEWGWTRFSCDEYIGEKLLQKQEIGALSQFIGKLGNPQKGGLDLAEFKKRQQMYTDAEGDALLEAAKMQKNKHFVNDSTGSLCEISDAKITDAIGAETLFVYIKTSKEEEDKVLERARTHPKPLFFPPAKFDGWLGEYMKDNKLAGIERVEPDDFARWVFPKLFESRLPKYQALADKHGVTIPSSIFHKFESVDDFVRGVASALESK